MSRNLYRLLIVLMVFSFPSNAADKAPLDGELVYRNNCTRCHMAIHTFSDPMLATVTRHMRVRATLTEAETDAVLKYLEESSPAPHSRNQRKANSDNSKK